MGSLTDTTRVVRRAHRLGLVRVDLLDEPEEGLPGGEPGGALSVHELHELRLTVEELALRKEHPGRIVGLEELGLTVRVNLEREPQRVQDRTVELEQEPFVLQELKGQRLHNWTSQ